MVHIPYPLCSGSGSCLGITSTLAAVACTFQQGSTPISRAINFGQVFFPPMTLPLFKTVDPGQLLPKSNTPLSFSPKEQNVVLWNTVVDRGSVYKIISRGLRNFILTFDLYKIVYPPSLRKVTTVTIIMSRKKSASPYLSFCCCQPLNKD